MQHFFHILLLSCLLYLFMVDIVQICGIFKALNMLKNALELVKKR